MTIHFMREINKLKKAILELAAMVEDRVWKSLKSVSEGDQKLAGIIIDSDFKIDEMEVNIEEDCLKVLALYQPVATDLRFIVAVLKINNDLERIGDLAANIAQSALHMASQKKMEFPSEFQAISDKTQQMLKDSLDAFVNLNFDLAQKVRDDDDEVDSLNKAIYDLVKDQIRKDINYLDSMIDFRSVSKNLERIADLATNIAEDVIYTIKGEIVRHKISDTKSNDIT